MVSPGRSNIFFTNRLLSLYLAIVLSFGMVGITNAAETTSPVRDVSPIHVFPYGYLPPDTPVTAVFTLNMTGAYPSDCEEQLFTGLEHPDWTYTIIVNGMENHRPLWEGSSLTISGFELSYRTTDAVSVLVTLRGDAPALNPPLTNFTVVRLQSVDGENEIVPGSVVIVEGQAAATHPPATDFTATPTTGEAPLVVFFRDISTNYPTCWNWSFGDGTVFNYSGLVPLNPIHTYTRSGSFPVSLTSANPVGSTTTIKTGYITVTNATTPVGVFRPSNGNWYLDSGKTGVTGRQFHFGMAGDIPVVGDWDGTGTPDAGIFRPSTGTWVLETTKTGTVFKRFHFGMAGDNPVTGDWDGDGTSDAGVFRPSTGTWVLETTKTGTVFKRFHFGMAGDIPVTGVWGGDGSMAGEGRIAFVSNRDQGNYEIYGMNADGTNQTRLTNTMAYTVYPAWSPDGSKIAFHSTQDGINSQIYVVNADGTGQVRLTNNTVFDAEPSYSPDGNKIAFRSHREGYMSVIYIMNADGTGQTRLTDNMYIDDHPSFSPDNTKIVFGCLNPPYRQICIMNADGTGKIRITNDTTNNLVPDWSPDGSKIAFVSFRNGHYDIYLMNTDGSAQTRLTNNSGDNYDPAWSPDGSRIAFDSEKDGQREIYQINADGTGQTRLTVNAADDWEPDWGISAFTTNKRSQAGVFRPSNGNWYLDYDKTGAVYKTFHFGTYGDIPVVGDWDGDGVTDIGVFRPSSGNWYLDYNKTGFADKKFHFGTTGDIPVTGSTSPIIPTPQGITSISPVFTVSPNVQMTILGSGFQEGCTVKLTRSTGSFQIITSRNVRWDSSTQVTSWFTLPNGTNGTWNIVVTNPDGSIRSRENGFEVRIPPPPVSLPVTFTPDLTTIPGITVTRPAGLS
jgi:TolB protein